MNPLAEWCIERCPTRNLPAQPAGARLVDPINESDPSSSRNLPEACRSSTPAVARAVQLTTVTVQISISPREDYRPSAFRIPARW